MTGRGSFRSTTSRGVFILPGIAERLASGGKKQALFGDSKVLLLVRYN